MLRPRLAATRTSKTPHPHNYNLIARRAIGVSWSLSSLRGFDDMTNVKNDLDHAVLQVRALSASMGSLLAELDAAGVWSGSDANEFQTAWREQVQRNMTLASTLLERVSFVPAG
jgi:hypothetical protein